MTLRVIKRYLKRYIKTLCYIKRYTLPINIDCSMARRIASFAVKLTFYIWTLFVAVAGRTVSSVIVYHM